MLGAEEVLKSLQHPYLRIVGLLPSDLTCWSGQDVKPRGSSPVGSEGGRNITGGVRMF